MNNRSFFSTKPLVLLVLLVLAIIFGGNRLKKSLATEADRNYQTEVVRLNREARYQDILRQAIKSYGDRLDYIAASHGYNPKAIVEAQQLPEVFDYRADLMCKNGAETWQDILKQVNAATLKVVTFEQVLAAYPDASPVTVLETYRNLPMQKDIASLDLIVAASKTYNNLIYDQNIAIDTVKLLTFANLPQSNRMVWRRSNLATK